MFVAECGNAEYDARLKLTLQWGRNMFVAE